MLRQHRQGGRSGIAALEEHIDDGGVDLATACHRRLAHRELANLFMGERVISRLVLSLGEQEARHDGRGQIVGQSVGPGRRCGGRRVRRRSIARQRLRLQLAFAEPRVDHPEISEAEAAAEYRCFPEHLPRPSRQACRAPIDQGSNRRRHQPRRVPSEPPHAIDLLQRAGLAVRPGELFDDEGHALGLDVHRGRGGRVDRTAEDPLEELCRLDRAEPADPQPSDETHPFHVGDEVHGFRHGRELVWPDRQHEEDRPIRVAPDHVPEEPKRVVVGPLDVVDKQCNRLDPGKCRDRDAGEIECAEELRIGRERLEARFIPSGYGFDDAFDRDLGRRPGRYILDRLRGEQAPGDQERPANLLVGRDRDTREPARGRTFQRGDQQAGLADPRLTLERHRREAIGCLP